jgi:hypothetical protein
MLDPALAERPQCFGCAGSNCVRDREQATHMPTVADRHNRLSVTFQGFRFFGYLRWLLAALDEVAVRTESEGLTPKRSR